MLKETLHKNGFQVVSKQALPNLWLLNFHQDNILTINTINLSTLLNILI